MKNRLILIGYMGCGKSTVGRSLADKLGWTFLDTDARIEEEEGTAISDIFTAKGEDYFRDLETACLKKLFQEEKAGELWEEKVVCEETLHKKGIVISVGGGLPVREENQKLLKEVGTVVYLKANPNTIYERLKDDDTRPLLQTSNPIQKIKDMLIFREEKYQAAANKVINVDGKSVLEIVEEIQKGQEYENFSN